jgi:hypothetical protein
MFIGMLAGVTSLLATTAQCAEPESLEYAVKAVYLTKFAPFVSWPASVSVGNGDAFVICDIGADPVTSALPQAAAGQQINGRPIEIRHLSDSDNPQACHILYIANTPAAAAVLSALHDKPVLTVTDGAGSDHGIIQLIVISHHVRFDIDEGMAANAGISISSKLLSLANTVTPAPADKK